MILVRVKCLSRTELSDHMHSYCYYIYHTENCFFCPISITHGGYNKIALCKTGLILYNHILEEVSIADGF